MFFVFTISACLLAIVNAHFLQDIDSYTVFQFGFFLLAGMIVFSNGSMKHRSVLDVMFLWATEVLVTDWMPPLPSVLVAIENAFWIGLIARVYYKEYFHISMPISSQNVCIAFYGGPNAPFLSRLASHFGYSFSSVAIIVNGKGVRPSQSRGCMVETTANALIAKGYVFIDTDIESSAEIVGQMKNIIGTKTGYGLLRFRCLKNLIPVLERLGYKWVPLDNLYFPSRYYKQCVRNVS